MITTTSNSGLGLDSRSRDLRALIVRALIGGNRGHLGSSMSLVEILRVLFDDHSMKDMDSTGNLYFSRLLKASSKLPPLIN